MVFFSLLIAIKCHHFHFFIQGRPLKGGVFFTAHNYTNINVKGLKITIGLQFLLEFNMLHQKISTLSYIMVGDVTINGENYQFHRKTGKKNLPINIRFKPILRKLSEASDGELLALLDNHDSYKYLR